MPVAEPGTVSAPRPGSGNSGSCQSPFFRARPQHFTLRGHGNMLLLMLLQLCSVGPWGVQEHLLPDIDPNPIRESANFRHGPWKSGHSSTSVTCFQPSSHHEAPKTWLRLPRLSAESIQMPQSHLLLFREMARVESFAGISLRRVCLLLAAAFWFRLGVVSCLCCRTCKQTHKYVHVKVNKGVYIYREREREGCTQSTTKN